MAQVSKRPTVILRDCRSYDAGLIRGIVRDALERLELRPRGRTLIKPNVVASGPHFPHAYTRPEFIEGVIGGLRERDEGAMRSLTVGERSGITMPTRFTFKYGGYDELAKRTGVDLCHFEEVPQVEIPLYHPQRLRDSLFTPQTVAEADFFVNCPKFKAHPWTTVTFSLKNYIGIQDDRHRLLDHHHQLDEKVADLQYVIQPQFVAIDAITAGEGRMLTPVPFDLGLVIMGDNQVAIDAVCCRIIGLDPLTVPHIRMAHERGFGPVELDEITLAGDVDLRAAKARAQGFRVGLVRVEDYFAGTNIRAYGGTPPQPRAGAGIDYCWGGCPGALEEAVEVIRLLDAAATDKLPPTHLVFGRWQQPLDVKPGEKVIFIGDCAEYRGPLGSAPLVDVPSLFRDRSSMSPLETKHDDIFVKMVSVMSHMRGLRRDDFIRLTGCPVSVAEQVLALVNHGKLQNPYTDLEVAPRFVSSYLSWRTRTALHRLMGQPYNKPGPHRRGQARPPQNLPPTGAAAPLEHGS